MRLIFFSGTIEPQEEEQYVEAEPAYEGEQDQGHFAEQGKPPHHPTEILLFLQSMFCFQNKIMHVLFLLWHLATQKLFYKILFGQKISTSI